MKIVERIEEMQSKLLKLLAESSLKSEEEAIRMLEEFGLDNTYAANMLYAFREAESARDKAKNVWKSALESNVANDNDIATFQQQELETRQYFDELNAESAFLMVIKRIDPNKIDEELLNELYQQGVREEQIINNPALKITYHYFSESKAKDIQRAADLEKVREYTIELNNRMTSLNNRLKESEKQNSSLKNYNQVLKTSYEKLQKKYKARVYTDEKYYQAARAQIVTLKDKLSQPQDMSMMQKMKLVFGRKRKELPEPQTRIPDTLLSAAEKMGIEKNQEDDLNIDMKQTPDLKGQKDSNIEQMQQ